MRFLEMPFHFGPSAFFVGSGAAGLVGVVCALSALNPTLRQGFRWGKRGVGGPVSAFGAAAWSFAACTWSVSLACAGLNSGSLSHVLEWALIVANVVLLIAAVSDAMRNRTNTEQPDTPPQLIAEKLGGEGRTR